MSDNKILELKDVSVGYNNISVASKVTFDICKGETFGLIGINGAGKTSLIKSIIGLRDPLEGEASLFGSITLTDEIKKYFGYLPERFDPPWFLTGKEFVKFTLELYNRPFDLSELHNFCHDINLEKAFLDKKMSTYSKGMRQKLGLVATLMSDVQLLILDEPMSGLDPLARVSVKKLLQKAVNKGQTIFLSSHILSDLDAMCDRIAVLDNKKINFLGKPEELKSRYKKDNLESAFLGLLEENRKDSLQGHKAA